MVSPKQYMAKAKRQEPQKNAGTQPLHKNAAEAVAEPRKPITLKTLAILLAAVALLTYANTLKNGFALDDISSITKNRIVTKGISAIPELLTTPYHLGFHPSDNDLYRPLSLVMFAAEHQLAPGNPMPGHLVNILLYGACVVVFFLFLNRLFGGRHTAIVFIASLLFAVHPIHTEVVANIKSRDELLCFFFAFLSLLKFERYATTSRWQQLAWGMVCYFLSLLSKETSITFAALIPLVFFCYLNEHRKRSIYITASAAVAAIAYLCIRYAVLHAYHADSTTTIPFIDNALVHVPAPASRIATAILLLGWYIKLLFIPHPLICDYAFNEIPFVGYGHWGFLLSAAIYLIVAATGIYRLYRYRKDALAFALLFFLITLSLFSNLFVLLGATMAERFVFFASGGFCLALALVPGLLPKRYQIDDAMLLRSTKTWLVLLPVVVTFVWMAMARNNEWLDNYTLYTSDLQKAPNNMRLYWYRGNELSGAIFEAETNMERKRQAMLEGVKNLQQSVAIYPDMLAAHEDLGHAFFMMQQFDSAMVHSRKVLVQDPDNAIALFNISGMYFSQEKYDSAIAYCHMAAVSDPGNYDIPRNIGFSYLQMKRYDSAIVYFRKVVTAYPESAFCLGAMARTFHEAGLPDSARKYEVLAKALEPGYRL
jgi:tetratricopeptide (TPR) repeat protein